jgi:hypothetical protein
MKYEKGFDMNKKELLEKFKSNDYDWIALGNDHVVNEHLKAAQEYAKDCMFKLIAQRAVGLNEQVDLERIEKILNDETNT